MEFLEVLTEGLERVLLVRGGGSEVITIYSWLDKHRKPASNKQECAGETRGRWWGSVGSAGARGRGPKRANHSSEDWVMATLLRPSSFHLHTFLSWCWFPSTCCQSYKNANTIPKRSMKQKTKTNNELCVCVRVRLCICVRVTHPRVLRLDGEGSRVVLGVSAFGRQTKGEAAERRGRHTDETQGCFLYRMYFGSRREFSLNVSI